VSHDVTQFASEPARIGRDSDAAVHAGAWIEARDDSAAEQPAPRAKRGVAACAIRLQVAHDRFTMDPFPDEIDNGA